MRTSASVAERSLAADVTNIVVKSCEGNRAVVTAEVIAMLGAWVGAQAEAKGQEAGDYIRFFFAEATEAAIDYHRQEIFVRTN